MAGTPSSVRFDSRVLERLSRYRGAHPELTLSSAANRFVDEGLRSDEHPLVMFRDGAAGRRARLVGGPDVWEVISAVLSARRANPGSSAAEVVEIVEETSGVPAPNVRAAVAYWADYPEEIDDFIARAEATAETAERRWNREQNLLGA